jgi:hypothetical protein
MIRFKRLRALASRHCFLEIASPSLAASASFLRERTVNSRSRLRIASPKTRP